MFRALELPARSMRNGDGKKTPRGGERGAREYAPSPLPR